MNSSHVRTPSYGSQTPIYGTGSRTPMYGSQTPLHDGNASTTLRCYSDLVSPVSLVTHNAVCFLFARQEAERLTTALRPRCMMGAGLQVRVEPGTPATPTHLPGNTPPHHHHPALFVSVFIKFIFLLLFYRNDEEYDFPYDDEPSPSPQAYGATPNPQTPGYPEVPSPQVNPQYNPQTPGTPAM